MGAHFRLAHTHLVLNLIKAFAEYPVILRIGPAAALYDCALCTYARGVYMKVWLRSVIKICDRSANEVLHVCSKLRVLWVCSGDNY
jgi:hypothetical protein